MTVRRFVCGRVRSALAAIKSHSYRIACVAPTRRPPSDLRTLCSHEPAFSARIFCPHFLIEPVIYGACRKTVGRQKHASARKLCLGDEKASADEANRTYANNSPNDTRRGRCSCSFGKYEHLSYSADVITQSFLSLSLALTAPDPCIRPLSRRQRIRRTFIHFILFIK